MVMKHTSFWQPLLNQHGCIHSFRARRCIFDLFFFFAATTIILMHFFLPWQYGLHSLDKSCVGCFNPSRDRAKKNINFYSRSTEVWNFLVKFRKKRKTSSAMFLKPFFFLKLKTSQVPAKNYFLSLETPKFIVNISHCDVAL